MFGGLNEKKLQAAMKQMGISQEEIDAKRVIIEKEDGKNLIIENPSVMRIKMQGQTSFQISGTEKEESYSAEDIKTIIEKTGASEQDARSALEETQDLAEAIIRLS